MSSQFKKTAQSRIVVLAILMFAWCAGILIRLVDLQVLRHGELLDKALRQQQHIINIVPRRGVLFDRQRHEMAISVDVDSLCAWGSQIKDPQVVAEAIGPILQMDPRDVEAKLESTRGFVWIKRKLDKPDADRIRAMNISGLEFIKESKRFYPKLQLASQVLGYVGLDNEGLGGVEYYYDSKIKGSPGRLLVQVDARQHRFAHEERGRSGGDDAVLTIDENIQYIAQKALDEAMVQTQAEAGTAIVMNPRTGEILAMANAPDFNPNRYKSFNPETWKNRAVQSIYEPGSVFKIVTVAASLNEGVANPDEVVDCQMGKIVLAGHTIHDHERLGFLSVEQIIEKSSDVGAIKLGLRLGEDRFYKYIRGFGFGSLTGVDLPGESRGIARDPNQWSKISIGAISMGQEVGVTPIQVLRAVAAIANDGVLVRPFLVKEIVDSDGRVVFANSVQSTPVVSARTAVMMKKMLEGVVLEGTGRRARLDGYTAAGKTGTAQKTDPATGRYYANKYVASFAGFTPLNNPELAIIVVLDSPVGLHQGGQVAAPAWKEIAEQTLRYLNVPPELPLMEVAKKAAPVVPSDELADFEANDSLTAPSSPSVQPPAMGSGISVQPVSANIDPAGPRIQEEKVFETTSTTVTVPSLLGKSLREATLDCQRAGVELVVDGSGFVVTQDPPAGTLVLPQSRVVAHLSRRSEKNGL